MKLWIDSATFLCVQIHLLAGLTISLTKKPVCFRLYATNVTLLDIRASLLIQIK